MIEVKDGNAKEKWVLFHCPECESEKGAAVELHVDYSDRTPIEMERRKRRMKRFDEIHEYCGLKELDSRISKGLAIFNRESTLNRKEEAV